MQRFVPWAMLLAVVAAALTLVRAAGRTDAWLAARWRNELAAAADDEAAALLARIGRLGAVGRRTLVELLGADREAIVAAAHAALERQIDGWESLDDDAANAQRAELAAALAAEAPHLAPAGLALAAELAATLLRQTPGGSAPPSLADDCERVCRLAACRPKRAATAPALALSTPDVRPTARELDHKLDLEELTALPGGGLPLEVAAFPGPRLKPSAVAVTKPPVETKRAGEPRRRALETPIANRPARLEAPLRK